MAAIDVPPEKSQTVSGNLSLITLAQAFPLSWSAYVRLLSVKDAHARQFLRGRGAARGLERAPARPADLQPVPRAHRAIERQSSDAGQGRGAQARGCRHARRCDQRPVCVGAPRPQDEYSESDLEAALIRRQEDFLLELGEGFTFIGRQRHLRIDQTWYRVDLLLFHRKLGSLTHADVGQMHMYCNYAKEHRAYPDENPPAGLILCADKGHALARYALEGLPTKVMAANYHMVLPDAELLQKELEDTRRLRESHSVKKSKKP